MLTEKQISALRAPFAPEALSADTSRGFELTSIKAAFVVERLNEVFGPCGCGWRYVHSPFERTDDEVLTEVALQFKVVQGGVNPVIWDTHAHQWTFIPDGEAWSWPIFAPGGRRPGKGTTPMTDARKGAITDGLTKAASMIGVGHEVFKGLVRVGQHPEPRKPGPAQSQSVKAGPLASKPEPATEQTEPAKPTVEPEKNGSQQPAGKVTQFPNAQGTQPASNGGQRAVLGANGANSQAHQVNATTYWTLANKYTDKLDRARVSALARQVVDGKLSWIEAQSRLDDMIDAATAPSFGAGKGDGGREKAPAAASAKPMAERASDPLDELFE